MSDKFETHEHDVIIIGAGGAGLRAAIEASNAGVSVGLVCKSLLGKAHTVMAEGGVAAAIGNVEPKDNWNSRSIVTNVEVGCARKQRDARLRIRRFFDDEMRARADRDA
jgi:aspartate oxidase